MSTLQVEVQTYNNALESLLPASMGKFALIRGRDLVSTFDSYEDALKSAYERFGLEHFFIKQIAPEENIAFFTRDLFACPA